MKLIILINDKIGTEITRQNVYSTSSDNILYTTADDNDKLVNKRKKILIIVRKHPTPYIPH